MWIIKNNIIPFKGFAAMIMFLLYLWQLPQNLLGLFLLLIYKGQKQTYGNIAYYYSNTMRGGISLGNYIIVSTHSTSTIKHEYGHQKQSLYLGWLYLLIVGLPSLIWAISCNDYRRYYRFYTEKWADKLGGVKR